MLFISLLKVITCLASSLVENHKAPIKAAHRLMFVADSFRDFIEILSFFFAVVLLFGLANLNVTNVFHLAAELPETRLKSCDAQSGRTHVHAAAARAEVHRHPDDSDFLWHLAFFQRPGRQVDLGQSRIDAIEHPWEGDDLADVLSPANPRDGALEAQSEAGMRHAAVTA